jgi:hypothetical protein
MLPELTLDLAGTDEFSLATPSLPRTDPIRAKDVLAYTNEREAT